MSETTVWELFPGSKIPPTSIELCQPPGRDCSEYNQDSSCQPKLNPGKQCYNVTSTVYPQYGPWNTNPYQDDVAIENGLKKQF